MTNVIKAPEPMVHFSFGEKSKAPKGFSDLQIGKEVTLTVKGKVCNLSDDYGCGLGLKGFTVTINKGSRLRTP